MKKSITYVGLDVHKETIAIALAEGAGTIDVRSYGTIGGDLASLDKAVRRLVSGGKKLSFAYEAGPCGYEIYRHLIKNGHECVVVAPSLIPRKSGVRIKNDRRDAVMLARLHRAGELTPVHVPSGKDEAIRDLTRAREDAKIAERKARQHINAFLLRHGHRYSGATAWSLAHRRWLTDISMPHAAQQFVLQEYIDAERICRERVARITEQIGQAIAAWRLGPVVEALQCLRGVSLVTAATIVSELGDVTRFDTPRKLMAYVGLVPSEYSSGESTKRGGITKTGNGHVRRVLVEASWAYRLSARVGRRLLDRQDGVSPRIWEIAWKAQVRLCARFKRLSFKGKRPHIVVTAIARELIGFVWAIAKETPMAA